MVIGGQNLMRPLSFQLISSVATYLIVMVQFQINEEASGQYNPKQGVISFAKGEEVDFGQ